MTPDRAAYSYRQDPDVPDFDDSGLLTVMDAQCSLCARGARWIARNDSAEQFKIIPLPSPLGTALMIHYGLDPDDPVSWLYLKDGKAYASMDAVIRVGHALGGMWKGFAVLRILPRRLQDSLYGLLARNRYRFGTSVTLCDLPDPDVRKRILS